MCTQTFDDISAKGKRHKMFLIVATHNHYAIDGKQINLLKLDKIFSNTNIFGMLERRGTAWDKNVYLFSLILKQICYY